MWPTPVSIMIHSGEVKGSGQVAKPGHDAISQQSMFSTGVVRITGSQWVCSRHQSIVCLLCWRQIDREREKICLR